MNAIISGLFYRHGPFEQMHHLNDLYIFKLHACTVRFMLKAKIKDRLGSRPDNKITSWEEEAIAPDRHVYI